MASSIVISQINIKYEKYTLPNGLQVILHEDHSVPIVAVNIWYHVGSGREKVGKSGFAHLFEHMLFQGSQNVEKGDHFRLLQDAGGTVNGSTSTDRTNYWEVVPSNFLELALFLESDRMGFLLEAMTQDKLDNQRDVVKNERRQNYENQPYGLAPKVINENLYPPDHPYHWLTIGTEEDLSNATLDDVKEFFKEYYIPNNASLCIGGAINPTEVKKLVEKYFGEIPSGKKIEKVKPSIPVLNENKYLLLEDNVQLPRLYISWLTVPHFTDSEAALNILADVISRGKNSRLFKSLVYEKQIAQDVMAYNNSAEISGSFTIVATAKPGISLKQIEEAIYSEIAKIKTEGITQRELDRSKNELEASFIYRLQSVGGFGGKTDQLNRYNIFLGDPGYFNKDLERYRKIKIDDVKAAATKFLKQTGKVVLSVVPKGKSDLQAKYSQIDRTKKPVEGKNPSFSLPKIQKGILSNGLKLMLVEHNELPIVQMQFVFHTGATYDPIEKPGLFNLMMRMMDAGTKKRSLLEISDEFAFLGSRFSASTNYDGSFVSVTTLKKNLEKTVEIVADILENSIFPETEFTRIKNEVLTGLMQQKDRPEVIANKVFSKILYGQLHPYGNPVDGTDESVNKISVEDVRTYFSNYIIPDNATLIIVGDVKIDKIKSLLEKKLKTWKNGETEIKNIPAPEADFTSGIYVVNKAKAPQSQIRVGGIGVRRNTPDYFALEVMNMILGGAFNSRINWNLREQKGYTYGARSNFAYRKEAGPFSAGGGFKSSVTDSCVYELLAEIKKMRNSDVTVEELEFAKNSLVRGFPRTFETLSQIAGYLGSLVLYNLPDDYFNSYIQNIEKVTIEDVRRVSEKYLHPDKMAIVIVGDYELNKSALENLNLGEVRLLDTDGKQLEGMDG